VRRIDNNDLERLRELCAEQARLWGGQEFELSVRWAARRLGVHRSYLHRLLLRLRRDGEIVLVHEGV
jgi:hypothetical protein